MGTFPSSLIIFKSAASSIEMFSIPFLVFAVHILAVDHDDVVDVQGADGGASKEAAVNIFGTAFDTYVQMFSRQMKNPIKY